MANNAQYANLYLLNENELTWSKFVYCSSDILYRIFAQVWFLTWCGFVCNFS